jgi:hypothetical protein
MEKDDPTARVCLKTCERWHSAIVRLHQNMPLRYGTPTFSFYATRLFAEYEACMVACLVSEVGSGNAGGGRVG